jgi:hypothetical protein
MLPQNGLEIHDGRENNFEWPNSRPDRAADLRILIR